MDSFSAVRERARTLRASPEERKGSLLGLAAVREALKEKGYVLYLIRPQDPLLNGGDAVLDRGMEASNFR